MEVYENGELDLESWDGTITWLAILMGFFFLLLSSEYLRKGAVVDDQKCLRYRNVTWALDDCQGCAEPCKVIVHHEYSKTDFMGQGTDNNIKRCKKDRRLCIPSLFSKLRVMNPSAFEERTRDAFLFTMSDGKVLSKIVVERLLRAAALRLGRAGYR